MSFHLSDQNLMVFIEVLNDTAQGVGSYINSYKASFDLLPGEEGLTDIVRLEYTKHMQNRFQQFQSHRNGLGAEIRGKYVGDRFKHVADQVVKAKEWKKGERFRVLFPTRCAENSTGWDFALSLNLDGEREHLIFVQAKRVTYTQGNQAEIHFDYSATKLQSVTFGKWLEYISEYCPGVAVKGWYLLYGIPNTPVAWMSWNQVARCQAKELDKRTLSSATVERARIRNRPGPNVAKHLWELLTSTDNFGFVVQDAKDEEILDDLCDIAEQCGLTMGFEYTRIKIKNALVDTIKEEEMQQERSSSIRDQGLARAEKDFQAMNKKNAEKTSGMSEEKKKMPFMWNDGQSQPNSNVYTKHNY